MAQPKQQAAEPTAEDQAKAQQVISAGAGAAIAAPPEQAEEEAKRAMRDEARRVDLKLSEEELDQIASKTAEMTARMTIDQLEQRGAFDALPESVQPPPQSAAPPLAAEQTAPPPAGGGGEPAPKPPQKRTFAHKFMGIP